MRQYKTYAPNYFLYILSFVVSITMYLKQLYLRVVLTWVFLMSLLLYLIPTLVFAVYMIVRHAPVLRQRQIFSVMYLFDKIYMVLKYFNIN